MLDAGWGYSWVASSFSRLRMTISAEVMLSMYIPYTGIAYTKVRTDTTNST